MTSLLGVVLQQRSAHSSLPAPGPSGQPCALPGCAAASHPSTLRLIQESLRKFDDVVAAAKAEGVAVRGYVSCVVGCPIQVRVGACPVQVDRCGHKGVRLPGRGTGRVGWHGGP